MKKAVRLSDIAQKLQVSTVTVSNALSGQKGVSDELRDKICKTAEEMGYRTKQGNGSSPMRRIFNIGVLISEKYLGESPSYYWRMYQELSLMARSYRGVILFEVLHHEEEAALRMPLFTIEKKIDGLLIIGEVGSTYLRSLYEEAGVPIVFVDFMKRSVPVPSVLANNYYGMYQMVYHLIRNGHRRIAYVGTVDANNSIMDRYFGYCKALKENGIEINPNWIIDDRTVSDGQIGNIQLPEDMPTAFACNCDVTAAEVVNTLKRQGYHVPEEISIVGFDNYLPEGLCNVKITTYEVNIREMMDCALRAIIAEVESQKMLWDMQFVPGRIVEKDSVKRITQ